MLFGVRESRSLLRRILRPVLSRRAKNTRSLEQNLQTAKQIARIVRAAANYGLYRAKCLEQALVLSSLIERHGIPNQISFGARKAARNIEAHAWVTCFGVDLNEDRGIEQRFSPFVEVTNTKPITDS